MKTKLYIAKFGGTSLADYQSITNCTNIVRNNSNIRMVVVSAPAGITNLLTKISNASISQIETHSIIAQIKTIIYDILGDLFITVEITQKIKSFIVDLELITLMLSRSHSEQLEDDLLSFGERISAYIFTLCLSQNNINAVYMDARSVIQTDSNFGYASPNLDKVRENCQSILLPNLKDCVIVIEGFIGANHKGLTTTLGRGGSDYSAALLAEGCKADILQIWTDVAGFYTTDPRIVPTAQVIKEFSFDEAAELATFGAKVIHPSSLLPVRRQNIPVFIGSSKNPKQGGSWIRDYKQQLSLPVIRGIAVRKNQSLLTISCLDMFNAKGFLAEVFIILARHNISIDLVTTSEVSVSITLDHSLCAMGASVEAISSAISELKQIPNIDISVESKLTLIALVGNHISSTPGVASRIFSSIENYNIRMFGHGASDHNICLLVSEQDDNVILRLLHHQLIHVEEYSE